MATQAQRRREALIAVRKQEQSFRAAQTAESKVRRELQRLLRRKTLITADEVQKLANLINAWLNLVIAVQRAFAILQGILSGLS